MPTNGGSLRETLCIPLDGKVFGCYGGSDSFNLPFVKQVIKSVVIDNPRIYFLFMNIDQFIDHPQVIFLPGNSDPKFKSSFINTCDAMLHARGIGESFGIACGEFSVHNKPVITYALSPQRNHLEVLGNKGILYKGPRDLQKILLEFDSAWSAKQDWDCYSQPFSPKNVMSQFSSIFLKDEAQRQMQIQFNLIDKLAIQGNRFRKKIRSLSRKIYQ
jgi:hypothetical protein